MSTPHWSSPQTDIVFIEGLQLSANVGPDCWGRKRSQPVDISVWLHLESSYLTTAGRSDNVADSVHYGHLSKAITGLVENKDGASFGDVDTLIKEVAAQAFLLAGSAASEVRVVVDLRKQILLAKGFCVEVIACSDPTSPFLLRHVTIADLVLPVIIGVNPPEREAKQPVITNILVVEKQGDHQAIDYPELISRISKVHPQIILVKM
jgi:FolB domain-containing protein